MHKKFEFEYEEFDEKQEMKAEDLALLNAAYDAVATAFAPANPPYTDSADFGPELKSFIEDNYKKPYKFNANLYAAFIKRCSELVNPDGYLGLLHPLTFMYISSFKDVRKYILTKTTIDTLAELGLGGVFANVQADVVAYTLKNSKSEANSAFLDFKKYKILIFNILYFKLLHAFFSFRNRSTRKFIFSFSSIIFLFSQ